MAGTLTPDVIDGIVELIPDAWLAMDRRRAKALAYRAAYRRYLLDRLASPRAFVEEAVRAR